MRVNFYDEIRAIIKEELDMSDEKLQEMIRAEIHQVVKSIVNRAVQKVTADEKRFDLESLVAQQVKRELSSYTGRDAIESAVKKVIPQIVSVQISLQSKDEF